MTRSAEARAGSAAPRDAIWDVLSDARAYADWGTWRESSLEREGAPEPNGVGAVRLMRRAPLTIREEITAYEPPSLLRYRLLSGIPVRDYEAEVRISESGEIHWRSEFTPKLPGTGALMSALIARTLADVATAVAREAERRSGA